MANIDECLLNAMISQTEKVSELGAKMDSGKEASDRLASSISELTDHLRKNGNRNIVDAIDTLESKCVSLGEQCAVTREDMKATGRKASGATMGSMVVAGLAIFSTVCLAVIAGVKTAEAIGLLEWFK